MLLPLFLTAFTALSTTILRELQNLVGRAARSRCLTREITLDRQVSPTIGLTDLLHNASSGHSETNYRVAACCAAFMTDFFTRSSPAQYRLVSCPSGSFR